MQRSKKDMWKGHCLSIGGVRKGYRFLSKRYIKRHYKGFDFRAEALRHWDKSLLSNPPPWPLATSMTNYLSCQATYHECVITETNRYPVSFPAQLEFKMSWICGIVGHQKITIFGCVAGGWWCITTFSFSTAFCSELGKENRTTLNVTVFGSYDENKR